MLTGDAGQRLYQAPFPWSAAGIDVRGRSRILRVNYRTTEQIRRFADRMREGQLATDDEMAATSSDAVSLLTGRVPEVVACRTAHEEAEALAAWVVDLLRSGYEPHEIAVFARTRDALAERAAPAVAAAGASALELREDLEPTEGKVSLATMHRAKGLEFRAVAAIACEARLLPLGWILRGLSDVTDRERFLAQERHLLYVACTRGRERLLVTHVGEVSPYLAESGIVGG